LGDPEFLGKPGEKVGRRAPFFGNPNPFWETPWVNTKPLGGSSKGAPSKKNPPRGHPPK